MKWIREDYSGNPQVWYSEDMIEIIKECCKEQQYLSSELIMKIN